MLPVTGLKAAEQPGGDSFGQLEARLLPVRRAGSKDEAAAESLDGLLIFSGLISVAHPEKGCGLGAALNNYDGYSNQL